MTRKMIGDRPKAIIYLIITAILWSLGGILIKLVDSNALAIAGTRSAIASLIIWLYLGKPRFNWSAAQIGAALSYTGTVILFVMSNKMTTAANAILLQYTAPVYVAILGVWLLKEKTRLFDWGAIFLTIGGMVLFFMDSLDTSGLAGNICALLSGICFALFTVFMRMQKDGSPLESVLLGNILTALIGIPFLFGDMPGTKGWIGLLLLGAVQLGVPYILYSKAVKHLTALETILIPVLEPVLNPVLVFLTIGEVPGTMAFVGGAVVLVVITAWCSIPVIKNRRMKTEEPGSMNSNAS
ncbi:MAG: DMT family transporter [Bacillota bacterium]|nr:DMT family transporter [Bacillota bacterium]